MPPPAPAPRPKHSRKGVGNSSGPRPDRLGSQESSASTELQSRGISLSTGQHGGVDSSISPSLGDNRGNAAGHGSRRRAAMNCAIEKGSGRSSSVGVREKQPAIMCSSGEAPQKMKAATRSTGEKQIAKLKAVTSSSGEKEHAKMKAGTFSTGEMLQKRSAAMKAGTCLTREMSQKRSVAMQAATRSTGEKSQKQNPAVQVATSLAAGMSQQCSSAAVQHVNEITMMKTPRLAQKSNRKEKMKPIITEVHAARENKQNKSDTSCMGQQDITTAQDREESAVSQMKAREEASHVIQRLNELGFGEDISFEEHQAYVAKLPACRSRVDTSTELDGEQLTNLEIRLALHRLNYIKERPKSSEEDDSELKKKCPVALIEKIFEWSKEDDNKLLSLECFKGDKHKLLHFLGEHEFFRPFEKDGTLDWSFHRDRWMLAGLSDYQRLVPRNYGGFEYVNWDEYRSYFHSYEIELEYVKYCEELSDKLKWMEDYTLLDLSSVLWAKVYTRGSHQATKIAAGFSMITYRLACTGYHEFLDNLSFDVALFKELDHVYFEIWHRTTKQKKCFKDALDEVYKITKFPLRQREIKRALDTDDPIMAEEFSTCTEGITEHVTNEKALELIAVAVKKLRKRPKFYEHYIRKKMDISRVIEVIP